MSDLLIGLYSNGSRAGKDSVAGVLVEDFGFTQRNMANAIRQILLDLNPVLKDDNGESWCLKDLFKAYDEDWDKVKAVSRDVVEYMIRLGQSCRDNIDPKVWLHTVLKERPRRLVIADVRQPNEYWAIKTGGGMVWKVVRPGIEKRGMDGLLEGYDFDVILYNNGSLSDLRGQVQGIVSSHIHGMYVKRNTFLNED